MPPVVYAETFGNASEVWIYRQVRALGSHVVTHEHRDPATFPYDRVAVVPKTRTPADRARTALRWLRDRHRYHLPASTEAALACRLRELQATLLHAHYGPVGLRILPVARRLGLPLVTTFHGFDISSLPAVDPSYRRALQSLFAAAWRVIAVSHTMRDRLADLGCPADRIAVISMGVPVAAPRPPHPGAPVVRVVTVARLHPKKGVPDLVDAVARARAAGAPIELDIVGEGPERAAVEQRIEAAGLRAAVRLHGALPPAQVSRLLAVADLFALNSRTAPDGDTEGLPVSILEAMEASLCVIATRHGGIQEAVADGDSGILVPERDTDALAQALLRMSRDPAARAAMGRAGRARVERDYDERRSIERLKELYAASS
ncbi:MAG TPA: glycosyltransferase [Planctomycetota bacterium]|nr:glycosyltransferase [Planctomycetota bacterium]